MKNRIRELSIEEYGETWADTYAKVFSGRDLDDHPFAASGWRQFPIGAPAFYFSEGFADRLSQSEERHCEVYRAILSAASMAGDDRVVLFLHRGPHLNPSIFELDGPTLSGLQELRLCPADGFDRHVFGRSAEWGLVVSWDEEIAVVGGTPAYIDALVTRAGGEDAIHDDFNAFSEYLNDLSLGWRNAVARLRAQAGW